MSGPIRSFRAALAVAVAAGITVFTPGTAAADSDCETEVESVEAADLTDQNTWAQRLFDMERVWPLATGKGVTVAVLDSGVQGDHPIFSGNVASGKAYVDPESTDRDSQDLSDNGTRDCLGHGTAVAGIIAGGKADGSDFYGMAPDVTILPVRVTNDDPNAAADEEDSSNDDPLVTPDDFADAIRYAVDHDADVINMSLKFDQDHPSIKAAVEYATEQGAVLVASGGNDGGEELADATRPAYPAAYEQVIGVGAVDQTLTKTQQSQWGFWINLVAPGAAVAAPQHDGGFQEAFGGTSGAAAFVSAAAALLVERYPNWSPEQYVTQLLLTASAVSGEVPSPEYGYGVVDPYRALTERLTGAEPVDITSFEPPMLTEAQATREEDFTWMNSVALIVALVAVAGFFITILSVAAIRRARRAGWRSRKASKEDMIEPVDDGDPIPLFQGIKGLKQ